jgi:serine/threonine-protein kinase PRP4
MDMNNDSFQPLSKRQKTSDVEKSDEDLSNLVHGDEFALVGREQELDARRRRADRKLRLHSARQKESGEGTDRNDDTDKDFLLPVRYAQNDQLQATATLSNKDMETVYQPVDKDNFDMFSSSPSPQDNMDYQTNSATSKSKRGNEQGDWDDSEGYYKAVIGEIIRLEQTIDSASGNSSRSEISFRISGVVGKGVFSTVLKCTTVSNSSSIQLPPTVALKFIRHNDTMAKAALNEVQTLQRLKGCDGIVPLLLPLTETPMEHRGHVVLAFSCMEYNLRDVLQKFGKGVGLSLQAVRSYFGQLLAAATHLKKNNIIHADLKPDNILVSADFSFVQLADFGSAIDASESEQNQPTPYLVSRFYRAPEIILGLTPTFAVDLWSLSVTAAELFLGEVLFKGSSNNDMLYSFMQHMGPISNRIIRQHLAGCQRFPISKQFAQEGASFLFKQQTTDPVTGRHVHRMLSLATSSNGGRFPSATPLHRVLLRAKSTKDNRIVVNRFSDLLVGCLSLDPSRRMGLKESLQHSFFQLENS